MPSIGLELAKSCVRKGGWRIPVGLLYPLAMVYIFMAFPSLEFDPAGRMRLFLFPMFMNGVFAMVLAMGIVSDNAIFASTLSGSLTNAGEGGKRTGAFPAHLFAMPATTARLVFWQGLCGILLVACSTLLSP